MKQLFPIALTFCLITIRGACIPLPQILESELSDEAHQGLFRILLARDFAEAETAYKVKKDAYERLKGLLQEKIKMPLFIQFEPLDSPAWLTFPEIIETDCDRRKKVYAEKNKAFLERLQIDPTRTLLELLQAMKSTKNFYQMWVDVRADLNYLYCDFKKAFLFVQQNKTKPLIFSQKDSDGNTLLHLAVLYSQKELLTYILSQQTVTAQRRNALPQPQD